MSRFESPALHPSSGRLPAAVMRGLLGVAAVAVTACLWVAVGAQAGHFGEQDTAQHVTLAPVVVSGVRLPPETDGRPRRRPGRRGLRQGRVFRTGPPRGIALTSLNEQELGQSPPRPRRHLRLAGACQLAGVAMGRVHVVVAAVPAVRGGHRRRRRSSARCCDLKHERVREVRSGGDTVISIGGKDGIRIIQDAAGEGRLPGGAAPRRGPWHRRPAAARRRRTRPWRRPPNRRSRALPDVEKALSEALGDEEVVVRRQVVTVRGILGDLGAARPGHPLRLPGGVQDHREEGGAGRCQGPHRRRTRRSAKPSSGSSPRPGCRCCRRRWSRISCSTPWRRCDYLIETDPPRASKMQKALITYLRGALPQMRAAVVDAGPRAAAGDLVPRT